MVVMFAFLAVMMVVRPEGLLPVPCGDLGPVGQQGHLVVEHLEEPAVGSDRHPVLAALHHHHPGGGGDDIIYGEEGNDTIDVTGNGNNRGSVVSINGMPTPPPRYAYGMQASYSDLMYHLTNYLVSKAGVKKLLFLGSTCVYPKMAPQPMPETALLSGPLEAFDDGASEAEIKAVYEDLLSRPRAAPPDLVVWPESALPCRALPSPRCDRLPRGQGQGGRWPCP